MDRCFQQSKTSVIRLHAMPKVLAITEKTTCMNEGDHINQFLRFTSEDELIRLAEIGLAVEMHQAAQQFLDGRPDVSYTGGNCDTTQSLPRTQSRRLMLAQGHGYPPQKE